MDKEKLKKIVLLSGLIDCLPYGILEKLSEADMELILSVETYSTEADYMIENDPVGFSNLVATLLVETAQEIKCSLS